MPDTKQHSTPAESNTVNEQELLDYLNNRLSASEKQAVEERLAQSELLQDAKEGLQLIDNKEALPEVVARLNRNLIRTLRKKRHRPRKPLPSQLPLLMTALILLLLLCLAFFLILRLKTQI